MKKLILMIALLPFQGFAEQTIHPDIFASNNNCSKLLDPTERRDCLNLEKKSEAKQNFKNFQENNQAPYKEEF
ncbi:hypothetical protein [Legionella sp. km772]|uniref:hypothetical protein n=1 Tax=Legionella sp. km772 TaxID=2498111 RepID=UPI000F8F510C|nr:hypothetical protein [Legionella sp. km772]RUR06455.1 hypothetical protein ELY15_13190 [Legionella sp. km772]